MLIRLLVIFLSIFFSMNGGEDNTTKIFETAPENTEGMPCGIVHGCVSVITGDFIDGEIDIELIGPQPLVLQRMYCSSDTSPSYLLDGWTLSQPTELLLIDKGKHGKHKVNAYLGEASGGKFYYKGKNKKDKVYAKKIIPLQLKKEMGFTNCGAGHICAQTNMENQQVNFNWTEGYPTCSVQSGAGDLRYFIMSIASVGNKAIMQLEWERKASNHVLNYRHDYQGQWLEEMSAWNDKENIKYSWITFKNTNINSSSFKHKPEYFIKTSDERTIHYEFLYHRYHKKNVCLYEQYYLKNVERPDRPNIRYSYEEKFNPGLLQLTRKDLPDQRFLAVEYYHEGLNEMGPLSSPNYKKGSKVIDRVKMLKAPVGADATPIPIYYFHYEPAATHNPSQFDPRKDSFTTVHDAYLRKTVYRYSIDHKLTSIEKYGRQNSPVWNEHYNWNGDRLKGTFITDQYSNYKKVRIFTYDDRGNIVKEVHWGNWTGKGGDIKINNLNDISGGEKYVKTFAYSQDKFNLLLSETDENEKTLLYGYCPNTNWMASRLVCSKDQILFREFNEYDCHGSMIKKIIDDGDAHDKNDLTSVTHRRITHFFPRQTTPFGLPERIDEMYLDLSNGEEVLNHRIFRAYSIEGRLLKEDHYDAGGVYRYTLEWRYDDHGNVVYHKNALGEETLSTYDQNNNCVHTQGPRHDFRIDNTYDFSNRLIRSEKTHAEGQRFAITHKYDFIGNRISTTDEWGNETKYIYDDFNRLSHSISPLVLNEHGQWVHPEAFIKYDLFDNPIEVKDARGFCTLTSYTTSGKPIAINHPDGTSERYTYTLGGRLAEAIASNGTLTKFTYDVIGRETSRTVIAPNGEILTAEQSVYKGFNLISKTDLLSGRTTKNTYDFSGRLVAINCGEEKTTFNYDELGRLIKTSQWDENGIVATVAQDYDLLDRLIEERIETGNTVQKRTSYAYDSQGNRVVVDEGDGYTLTEYDLLQRPIRIVDPDGNATIISYQTAFNDIQQTVLQAIKIDALGNQTITTMDGLMRPRTIVSKNSMGFVTASHTILHDAYGNKARLIQDVVENHDSKGQITTFWEYNAANQMTAQIEALGTPDQKITRYVYNAFGQKEAIIKPDGVQILHNYDGKGRLANFYASDESFHYSYLYASDDQILEVNDHKNQTKTQRIYDEMGRLTQETFGNGLTLNYIIDPLKRMTALQLPNGQEIQYTYEGALLKTVSFDSFTHTYAEYNRNGKLTKSQLAGNAGEINTQYDRQKRPIHISHPCFEQKINAFDALGNLLERTITDGHGKKDYHFTYDALYQLTSEPEHAYTYNSLKNRTSVDGNCCSLNALNQLLACASTTCTYDLNGNLTQMTSSSGVINYSYDALDRLIKVVKNGQEIAYTYDSFNRRLSKNTPVGQIDFIYQQQAEIGAFEKGQLIELRVLGMGKTEEIGAAVFIKIKEGLFAPIHDHNGNIMCLVDVLTGFRADSYRYTAFGEEETAVNTTNPWRWASKRIDEETGLVYFGQRYYCSSLGRWITTDPIGYKDGPNLYAYVHNNPLTCIDAFGLYTEEEELTKTAPIENREKKFSKLTSIPELEYIKKRSYEREKTQRHDLGLPNPTELAITIVNGIHSLVKNLKEVSHKISAMAGDINIHMVHNAPRGAVITDLVRSFFRLYFHIRFSAEKALCSEWDARLKSLPQDIPILHYCHSEGAIITRNALEVYENNQRIIVVAIAPGGYISKELCKEIHHYCSTHDIVPLCDVLGRLRCKDTTTILDRHPEASFWDHDFNSKTYEVTIKNHVELYINEYGKK